jgi:uridine kinase
MSPDGILIDREKFSAQLFELMQQVNPGLCELELYEFRYGLNNLEPGNGNWEDIVLDDIERIEQRITDIEFYKSIKIKPKVGYQIVLDPAILHLTNMLFAGLVAGKYPIEWVKQHFYFDIRGFYFLHHTAYFTPTVMAHFGGKPYLQFEQKQLKFVSQQDVGYRQFKLANADIDRAFIQSAQKLIAAKGTPVVLAIAGPTAAGKTEIVERLHAAFSEAGQHTTSIEMDNFLTDRDYREEMGIHTQGKEALHLQLLQNSLDQICQGKKITIPRYDFVYATSSHDLQGNLKPDGIPVEVEPADIIFIEGNFPFLVEEISQYIGIKVVYLTDDAVRMKRKWKRDIDYRKKYEPTYFRNRFFKDQFVMAQLAYIPQMEISDIVVHTTGAALWVAPHFQVLLGTEQ